MGTKTFCKKKRKLKGGCGKKEERPKEKAKENRSLNLAVTAKGGITVPTKRGFTEAGGAGSLATKEDRGRSRWDKAVVLSYGQGNWEEERRELGGFPVRAWGSRGGRPASGKRKWESCF